jgi:hypothetical protein
MRQRVHNRPLPRNESPNGGVSAVTNPIAAVVSEERKLKIPKGGWLLEIRTVKRKVTEPADTWKKQDSQLKH